MGADFRRLAHEPTVSDGLFTSGTVNHLWYKGLTRHEQTTLSSTDPHPASAATGAGGEDRGGMRTLAGDDAPGGGDAAGTDAYSSGQQRCALVGGVGEQLRAGIEHGNRGRVEARDGGARGQRKQHQRHPAD